MATGSFSFGTSIPLESCKVILGDLEGDVISMFLYMPVGV